MCAAKNKGDDMRALMTATGTYHSLALCEDGTVQAWGANTYGPLRPGTNTGMLRARIVPSPSWP